MNKQIAGQLAALVDRLKIIEAKFTGCGVSINNSKFNFIPRQNGNPTCTLCSTESRYVLSPLRPERLCILQWKVKYELSPR